MKGLHDSPIGDFTRGGQTTLMMIRMIGEVFSRFGGAMLIVYTAATIALFMHRSEPYQRYLLMRYAGSAIAVTLMANGDKPTLIQNPDGSTQTVTFRAVYNAPIMKANLHSALYLWLWNMLASMMGCLMVLAMVFGAMIRFGKRLTKEEHIRGARLVDSLAATRYLKENKVSSDLRIAGVPLYAGKETSHVILTGAPGTGKSTTLYELMTRIRSRGDRCICFSPAGEFIEWFYRAERDVLLNPFDQRCPYWNMWDEITKVSDPDMLAAAWVPVPAEGDKFWAEAGQSLISDLIGTMREQLRP